LNENQKKKTKKEKGEIVSRESIVIENRVIKDR
jgi:hypothetical protein